VSLLVTARARLVGVAAPGRHLVSMNANSPAPGARREYAAVYDAVNQR